jgi:hypothetical protein
MAERRQYLTLTPRPHAFKSIAEPRSKLAAMVRLSTRPHEKPRKYQYQLSDVQGPPKGTDSYLRGWGIVVWCVRRGGGLDS